LFAVPGLSSLAAKKRSESGQQRQRSQQEASSFRSTSASAIANVRGDASADREGHTQYQTTAEFEV